MSKMTPDDVLQATASVIKDERARNEAALAEAIEQLRAEHADADPNALLKSASVALIAANTRALQQAIDGYLLRRSVDLKRGDLPAPVAKVLK